MRTAIADNLAYQRYALETLHRSLLDKRRRFECGDFGHAANLENTIIRLADNITTARKELARMLDGTPVLEYAGSVGGAAADLITRLAGELESREEECRREHEALKAYAAAMGRHTAFCGSGSGEDRSVTIQ